MASNKEDNDVEVVGEVGLGAGDVEVLGSDSEDEDDILIPSTSEMYQMVEKIRTFMSYHRLDSYG